MYWNMVLKEVLNKHDPSYKFVFTHCYQHPTKSNSGKILNKDMITRRRTMKNYFLGEKYTGIAFTRRESECMVQMLKGKTISKVATTLKLSPRTVEFYLKKMKNKLECRTKSELIEKVLDSDFLQQIDF